VQIKQVGDTKAHLKLLLKDASGTQANAIAFGWGGYYEQLQGGVPFEILYVLEENHFQGITTLQLQIKDLKIEA
jgi:single-stranded-DNA-specific exonuclease